MVSVAERAPVAPGVKVTLMLQELLSGPCCRGLGQPLLITKSEALVPLKATDEMVTGAVPVLVTTTLGLRGLWTVATCDPKLMDARLTSRACRAATPFPVSVADFGLPVAPV